MSVDTTLDKENRAKIAKDFVRSKGYCGSIMYRNGIAERICLKPKHDDNKHSFNSDDCLITKVLPF